MRGILIFSMICNIILLWWCWRLDDRLSKAEGVLDALHMEIDKLKEKVSFLCRKPLTVHEDDAKMLQFDAYKRGEVQKNEG